MTFRSEAEALAFTRTPRSATPRAPPDPRTQPQQRAAGSSFQVERSDLGLRASARAPLERRVSSATLDHQQTAQA